MTKKLLLAGLGMLVFTFTAGLCADVHVDCSTYDPGLAS